MELKGKTPDVVFTNANLAQSSMGLRSPSWIGEFAAGAGFDGVEYHPIYDLNFPAKSIVRAQQTGCLVLNSLHSSFRTNLASNDANQDPEVEKSRIDQLVSSRLGRLLMPEMVQSAKWMKTIQDRLPKRVPAIFYPQKSFSRDQLMLAKSGANCKLFQPTDHVARLFEVEIPRNLSMAMHNRGYDGYCADTFHMRRYYGRDKCQRGPVSDMETSLDYLAPQVRALHISLYRQDFAAREPHIPTEQELKAALSGAYTGQLKEIIDTCLEQSSVRYAVVELTSKDLACFTGHKDKKSLQQSYADIASGLKDYFEAALAKTAL